MLKKLLTLCLAFLMFSSVALASPENPVLLAETEEAPLEETPILEEAEPVSLTQDDMEFLLVDTDGNRTSKMKTPVVEFNWERRHNLKYNGGSNEGGAEVMLVKAFIGTDLALEYSAIDFSAYIRSANTNTYTAHVAPLTKAKYDEAVAAVTSGATVSGITLPSVAPNHNSSGEMSITKSNYKNPSVIVSGSFYDENSYVNGYLYMAVEWTIKSGDYAAASAQVDNVAELLDKNGVDTACVLNVNGMKYVDSSDTTLVPNDKTFTADDMNILLYDAETGKTEPYTFSNTSRIALKKDAAAYDWFLMKVKVGNWELSSLETFKLATNVYFTAAGKIDQYVAPLKNSDFEDALSGKVVTLTAPSAAVNKDTKDSEKDKGGSSTINANITPAFYGADSYSGGYLYMAVEWVMTDDTSDDKVANAGFDKGAETKGKWNLNLSGMEIVVSDSEVVDDFSDAVIAYDNSTGAYTITTTTTTAEAYLIIASFTGTAMNDIELVTIDSVDKLSGSVTPLDAGTIKIFLLNKATLAPAIGVTTP